MIPPPVDTGEAPINIRLSYAAADDGRPCAVMEYNVEPRYDYDNLHGQVRKIYTLLYDIKTNNFSIKKRRKLK